MATVTEMNMIMLMTTGTAKPALMTTITDMRHVLTMHRP